MLTNELVIFNNQLLLIQDSLQDSGLVPKFVKKENYGTVPKYLEARKKQMAEHQKNYEQYIQQRLQKGALNQISAEER